ncbi:hypothetical protein PHYBOEH_012073 [Phytophthora boehmeriae]|uniref:Uncharacterized protein n=1 Tax=Phytophthora boehmeriae TaxID=109152 RepID=A0A8T1VCI1_9STRA|nr:hypothetical protein PHYBOEH_012073 [Phytophthora boehmeriae]
MGGTESNEVAKDDARLQHPMVLRSAPAPAQKGKSKKENDTVITTAKDGTKTAVTTSADGASVTTVVTKPDGSSTTTTETVTTTESEVGLTQLLGKQGASPTAAAAASAIADFESVSEEKKKRAQSLEEELAWHAWSGSAIAAAMGVKSSDVETSLDVSDHSGVLFVSTVVTAQAGNSVSGAVASSEAGGERKRGDFKKWLPAFLAYVTSHGRHLEALTAVELFIFARAFCRFRVLASSVDQEKEEKNQADRAQILTARRAKERKVAWELARAFTLYYPEFPIRRRGLRFNKTNRILMDQVPVENESSFHFIALHRRMSTWLRKVIVVSLLRESSDDCTCAENTIVIHDGEIVHSGSWGESIKYVQALGIACPSRKEVAMHLNKHGSQKATAALFDRHQAATSPSVFFRLADDIVMLSEAPLVDTSDSETRLHITNVGRFSKTQAASSSKHDVLSKKPTPGAYMYNLHSNENTSDSDDGDDNNSFNAGEWLMSWFNPPTQGPQMAETVEETVEEVEVTEGKKPKSKKHRKPKRKPTTETTEETIEVTEVTEVTTESTPTPEETTEVIEVTEVTETIETTEDVPSTTEVTVSETTETTETVEETVEEVEVTEGKKPKSKKHRKPKRKPTTETTEEMKKGETSSTVQTETREEIDDSAAVSATATTSASAADETLVSLSTEEEKGDDGAAGAIVKTEVFRTVGANGSVITKTIRTTIRKVTTSTGLAKKLIEVRTTTVTETKTGETSSTVQTETREEIDDSAANFASFEDGFFNSGSYEEKRATWTIARSLSFHYPGVAVQQLGLGVGKFQRTLLIDEVCHARDGPDGNPVMEVEFVLSALQVVPKKCAYYEDVLILENGEVLFHGTGESLISYFQELGFVCPTGVSVSDYLLNLNKEQEVHHQVTMIQGFNNQRQLRRSRMFSGLMKFADDMVMITGAPGAGGPSRSNTPVSSPMRSGSTARLSTSYSPLRRQLKHRFAQGSPTKSPFRSTTAGFASPQSANATKSLRITAYSSPESKKPANSMIAGYSLPAVGRGSTMTSSFSSPLTTKSTSYSSPITEIKGSTTSRRISVEGGNTVITEEVTSPRGTKRVMTTRHATKDSPSTSTA